MNDERTKLFETRVSSLLEEAPGAIDELRDRYHGEFGEEPGSAHMVALVALTLVMNGSARIVPGKPPRIHLNDDPSRLIDDTFQE